MVLDPQISGICGIRGLGIDYVLLLLVFVKPVMSVFVSELLQHHVTGNVICSPVVQGHVTTRSLLNTLLNLRLLNGSVLVEEGSVQQADIMATNGAIHVIDTVLIPPQGCHGEFS